MFSIATTVAAVCVLLSAAGSAYFPLSIWAAKRYRQRSHHAVDPQFAPPVSILKSLKGLDPHMYAAFRSHCLLDYPEYEVLFGVSDPSDPALSLVKRLWREFPRCNLRVVHCPEALGLNGKVSNLAQMLPEARYEHVIVNDSDILVERDYLWRVLAPFRQPNVGMVTTLYRGLAGSTLGSKLEALGLSTDFTGGVLIARMMEGGIRFGLGATIATTKSVLHEIGGFEALVDYLGDDYELGARAASAGHTLELADTIVETALPELHIQGFLGAPDALGAQHQRPQASTILWPDRDIRIGMGDPRRRRCPPALVDLARPCDHRGVARLLAIVVGRGVLDDPRVLGDLWLVPLRDFVALAIWLASFAGNKVEWRGLKFRLRDGKLEKV